MALPQNIWKSPVILDRLQQEAAFEGYCGIADKPCYYFLAPEGDTGRNFVTLKNFKTGLFVDNPHEMQIIFAQQLQEYFQKEIHFGGHWLIGWTHPPSSVEYLKMEGDNAWRRLVMIWCDEDGDPHFTVESEMPVITMIENGAQYYAELANKSYEEWNEQYGKRAIKDDFGLKEDQQKKQALEALGKA